MDSIDPKTDQTISEIRQELQEQEKRYRKRAVNAVTAASIGKFSQHYRRESAYYRGKADGIREALKAYSERGL